MMLEKDIINHVKDDVSSTFNDEIVVEEVMQNEIDDVIKSDNVIEIRDLYKSYGKNFAFFNR